MKYSAPNTKLSSSKAKKMTGSLRDDISVEPGQGLMRHVAVVKRGILSRIGTLAKVSVSGLALAAVAWPSSVGAIEWSNDRTVRSDIDYPGDGLIINSRAVINITNSAVVRAYDLSIQGSSVVNIDTGSFMTNYNSWSLIRNNATVTVASGASLRSNQYVYVTGDTYAQGGTLVINGGGAIRRNDGSSRHVVQLGNGGTLVLGNGTSTAPMLQYYDGNTLYSTGGWIVSDGWNSNIVVNMAGSYSIPNIRPYADDGTNMNDIALTVQAGDVVFDQPSSWEGALRSITISGGTLEWKDGGQSIASSASIAGGSRLIITNASNVNLANFTGSGVVELRNTSGRTVSNTNYTGDTILTNGGSLWIQHVVPTSLQMNSGTRSDLLATGGVKGFFGSGSITIYGGSLTASSDFGGSVVFGTTQPAAFAGGRHRFSGSFTTNGASITIADGGTFALAGAADISGMSSVSIGDTGTLDFSEITPSQSVGRIVNLGSTGGRVTLGAGGLVVNASQAGDRFSGVISGAAGLTVNGGADKAMELAGVNTYSGLTTIHNGATLKLVNTGSVSASGQVYIYSSGTLDVSGVSAATSSIRDLRGTVAGNIVLGSKTLRITSPTDTDYYNGTVSGTGGLRISGGTQKFGADLTYTGATTVDSGAVMWLGNGGTSGSIVNGATVNGELVIDRGNSYDLTAARIVSGSGMLSKLGTGELLVRAAQTYTGATNIRNGSIVILDDGSLAQSSTVNIDATGTFDLSRSNNGATIKALSGNGSVLLGSQNGQRGMTITAGGVFGGSISGYGDLRISGGNQTLTGNNSFTGTVYLGGTGNLTIGSASVPNQGSLANANVETGTSGRLIFMRSDANGAFGGRVQGSGGITQAGTGMTTLTGDANTYTGETIISAGTLRLSGASSLDRSSGVTIAASGTFDISAINGATTVKKVSGNGVVNLAGKTLTLAEQNGAFGGRFTGTGGSLVLAGPQLSISQDSDFTGSLTINSGSSLIATGAAKLSGASNLIVSGTLDVSGLNAATTTFVATSISGSGGSIMLGAKGLDITAGRTVDDFNGAIQGTGTLRILGGTQSLSGSNTYSGVTTIADNATLRITGGGSVGSSSGVTVGQTGTFDISGTAGGALPGTAVQALSGSGIVQLGTTSGTARTLSITSSGTYGGVISGFGDLRVSGAGTQTLTGNSTFTGWVRVASGSIRIGDGGTTGALLNANVEVQSGQQLIFQRSDALGTFGGQVTGTGELVQLGTGTTTLGNTNSYTGATRVQTGRLALGVAGDISSSSNVIISGSASLDISATSAGASIKQIASSGAGTATVTLGSKTLSLTQQNGTFGGTISGSGGLVLGNFSQLLTLTGTHSYTGATTVSTGTLSLTGASSIATSSGLTVDGTLDISGHTGNAIIASLAGSNTAGRVLLGSNTLEVVNSSGIFAGVISGNGGLLLRSGNLTLTNANTYSGLTTIASGGYLTLGNGGSSGEVQGNVAFSGAGELRFNRSNAVTFTNAISGAGSVVQQGAGSTTFTTAQGYTGLTRIIAGSLRLESGGSIASSSEVVADANFNVSQVTNPSVTIRSLSGASSGTVTLGDRNLIVSNAAGVFAGTVSGAGGQVTVGAGSLTLTGNNIYTGQTAVQSGASLLIGTGGTTGAIQSASLLNDGTVVFSRSNALTYAGTISGAGIVRQAGSGTTVLTGAVAAGGGVQVTAGTLSVEGANAFSPNVSISTGATLSFGKTQEFVYSGVVSGAGRLVQAGVGANGKLIVTGANTFTGGTTINSGAILQLGSNAVGGSASGSLVGNIANAGTLIVNRSNALALSGVISGAGGFTQNGNGKTTLSGANTYTGTTQVNAGELAVNGSLGNTNVVVANGATLSGTGTIGGNVVVAGSLNPGQSPGTMTVQGNLSLGSSSVSNFELGEAGVVGGANNDLVIVNGALTLNGTLNVTASNAGYYRLFNVGNGISGTFQTVNLLGGVAGSYATVYTDTPDVNGQATQVNIRLLDANQRIQAWDGTRFTGGSVAQGGSGTWNASNTNWLAPGSQISGAWGGSIARFGGTAGTVTIQGTIGFGELSFDVSGYTLVGSAGNALQLSSGGSTQTSSIISVANGASASIGAQIVNGDLSSLTKVGSGRLILTANNTYTGDTYVTAGVLQLGDNGASNTGSVAGNIANSGEVVISRSGAMTYAGIISGGIEPNEGGIVTLAGTSNVTFTGVNTYTGVTNVNDGVLKLSGNGSIANSATVNIGAGTLDIALVGNGGTSIKSVAGSGSVTLGNNTLTVTSASGTYGGIVSGNGGLTLRDGTLVLNNANTFTGNTTLLGGVLRLTDVTPSGNPLRTGSVAGQIVTGAGVNSGRLVLDYSTAVTPIMANAISGTGVLQKQGTGTVHLTGNATHTGGTVIRGGTLRIGNSGTSGALSGNVDTGDGTGSGRLEFWRSNDYTFAGNISGTGVLSQNGAGRTFLTGNASHSGGTQLVNGTLLIGNGGATGSLSGNVSAAAGTTLAFNRDASALLNYTGIVSGAGNVRQDGSGVTKLTAAQTYTGTTNIANGTLALEGAGQIGGTSILTIAAPGVFDITSTSGVSVKRVAGAGSVVLGNQTLTIGQANNDIFAGVMSGTGGVTLAAGTQSFTGANIYSGVTRISSGASLSLGGTSGSVAGNIANAGTLTFGHSSGTHVYAGSISGAGILSKTNGGTLVLTGANNYSGATNVTGGTLRVDGSLTGSAVTVASGATLSGGALYDANGTAISGTGVINGAVAIQNGAVLNAGSDLRVASLTLQAGSTTNFSVAEPDVTSSALNSRVIVTNGLSLNGTLNVSVEKSGYYRLFSASGITGDFATVNVSSSSATQVIRDYNVFKEGGNPVTELNIIVLGDNEVRQFWNGPRTSAGTLVGGTGTWNGTNTNWLSPDYSSVAPWVGSYAVFDGTAGTVTVEGTQEFDRLQFKSDGYALVAGTNAGLKLNNLGMVIVDGQRTATVGVALVNGSSDGLTKTGSGTLNLSATNAYTGYTFIEAGTLALTGTGSIAQSSDVQIGIDGTFNIGGSGQASTAIQGLSGLGSVALGSKTLELTSGTHAFGGVISGAGGITVSGGAHSLSGGNSFTGIARVTHGTLVANGLNALSTASYVSLDNADAVLDVSGPPAGGVAINSIAGIGQVYLGSRDLTILNGSAGGGASGTFGGTLSGAGNLALLNGALRLTGHNTFTGTTSVASSATLNIGGGTTSGSLAGNVINDGTLDFNYASGSHVYNGLISGAGTVNVRGTNAANVILTSANTFTGEAIVHNGTLSLAGDGSVASANLVRIGNTATFDIAGINADTTTVKGLTGAGSVTLGSKTLSVDGGNTDYYGTISGSSQSVLSIASGRLTSLGAINDTSVVIAEGAGLNVGNGQNFGSLSGDVVANGDLVFNRAGAVNFGNTIGGTGRLLKLGAGTLTLTAQNDFTGTTTVGAGTLRLAVDGTLNGDIVNNANVQFARGDDWTYGGAMTGTGSLVISSAQTTVTGDLTHTGGTTVESASLQIGNGGSTGSVSGNIVNNSSLIFNRSNTIVYGGEISGVGSLTQAGPGTTILTSSNAYSGGTAILAGTLQLGDGTSDGAIEGDVANSGTLAFQQNGASLFSGLVSGSGDLIQKGPGTVILTADNTYTGTTTIASGSRLQVGDGGSTGRISNTVSNDGTLSFAQNSDVVFNGVISGTGNLLQAGSATLTLEAEQSYFGATDVVAGAVLALVGDGSIAGSSVLGLRGTFDISGISAGSTSVVDLSGDGDVQLGSRTLVLSNAASEFSGNIDGDGGVTVSAGSWKILTGQTFTGVTNVAANANLALVADGSVSSSSSVIADGTFSIADTTTGSSIKSLSGSQNGSVILGDHVLTISDAAGTYEGTITGNGGLTVAGGTLVLKGANRYSGATTVASGATLDLHANPSSASAGDFAVDGDLNVLVGSGLVFGYDKTIIGSGTLTKSGDGRLIISDASNASGFVGHTVVTQGEFTVNGNLGGNVTALSRGTLSGKGFIGGNVAIGSGGTLSAGTSPGTLTINGNLSLASNSTSKFELSQANVVGGAANDHVIVNGALDVDGTLDAVVSSIGYYRLFSAGSITGNFATVNVTGLSGQIDTEVYVNNPGPETVMNLSVIGQGDHLQFWDGADTVGDNLLDGGSGTWSSASTNWTDAFGNINSSWRSSLAVFGGSAGLVTVDGDQSFSALQFDTDGYTLQAASSGGRLLLQPSSGNPNASINVSAGITAAIDTVIADGTANTLVKGFGGELVLSAANTYTGSTQILAGTLTLSGSGSVANSSGIAVSENSVFDVSSTLTSQVEIARLAGFGSVVLGNHTLVIANQDTTAAGFNGVFGGALSGQGGGLNLAGGSLTLSGTNTYTGLTTVASGSSLQIGNGAATGSIAGNLQIDGTATFNHGDGLRLFAGDISGAGTFVKKGTSTLNLTGNSAGFSGDVVVAGGKLAVNGALGGTVTVQASGTLGGSGTINGNTEVLAGGTLSAGNSPGTLTVNGNLSLNSGSTSMFELGQRGVIGGQNNDLVIVNGALVYGGALNVSANSAGFYRLFEANSVSGDFDAVNITIGGVTGNGQVYVNGPGTAKTVNLAVLKDGQNMLFWDGSDTVGNGIVEGGAGTWSVAHTNWTSGTGEAEINGPWGGSVGVFSGVGGDITVVGAQQFDTLQFTVDGYKLVPDTSGSLTFAEATGGTINVGAGATTTIATQITGGSSLGFVKTGAGSLVLTADNTYVGGTTIDAGVLQLGAGGTSGSIIGDIVNNGSLVTNRNDLLTLTGTISGTGSLTNIGGGTTLLTANNTYNGGTTINNGAIQLGNGGETGSVTGAVSVGSDGSLVINRSNDFTLVTELSGTGNVRQIGPNVTTLQGNSCAFTGTTTVTNGKLIVNGCLGGTVVVENGGSVGGDGTIGGGTGTGGGAGGGNGGTVTIGNGGTFSPGGDGTTGQTTITTNLSIASGAIYIVNVNAAGQSDHTQVNGLATITGGTVQVVAAAGEYRPVTRYTIMTANGGVTLGGDNQGFDAVTSNLAFLTPTLDYDPNHVYLTMTRNNVSFETVSQTPNQINVGRAIETLNPGNPLYDAVVGLDTEAARKAFADLSGEIHATLLGSGIESSLTLQDAVTNRMRVAFGRAGGTATQSTIEIGDGGFTAEPETQAAVVWGTVYGSSRSTSSDGNASAADAKSGGIINGFDMVLDGGMFDEWRIGGVARYETSSLSVDDRSSSAQADSYSLGVYGGGNAGQFNFNLGALYTLMDVTTDRDVTIGSFSDSLSADYTIGVSHLFGEVAYQMDVDGSTIEPFAGVAYVRAKGGSYAEDGGAAALSSSGDSFSTAFTTLGVRAQTTFEIDDGLAITSKASVGWRHAYNDIPDARLAFAGQSGFEMQGLPIGKDALLLDFGVETKLSENVSVGLNYSGQFSSGSSQNTGKVTLDWRF